MHHRRRPGRRLACRCAGAFGAANADPRTGRSGGQRLRQLGPGRRIGRHIARREFDFRRLGRGGTGRIWSGFSPQLTPIDFARRSWVPHSGWPFTFEDLAPFYARAASVLRLPFHESRDAAWEGTGLEIVDAPRSPRRFEAPPAGALLEGAAVRRLIMASSGRSIESADVALDDGRSGQVRADAFVLAAGGIETPRLLLNSEIGNDVVGRFFADHAYVMAPLTSAGAARARSLLSRRGDAGLRLITLSDEERRARRLSGVAGIVRDMADATDSPTRLAWRRVRRYAATGDVPPRPWATLALAAAGLPSKAAGRLLGRIFSPRFVLRVAVESVPRSNSRVSLGEARDHLGLPVARVDWRPRRRRCSGPEGLRGPPR